MSKEFYGDKMAKEELDSDTETTRRELGKPRPWRGASAGAEAATIIWLRELTARRGIGGLPAETPPPEIVDSLGPLAVGNAQPPEATPPESFPEPPELPPAA